MFSTSGWTTIDWVVYSQLLMGMIVALNVVFDLVFGFVGLYAGSMLGKPKKAEKSQKHIPPLFVIATLLAVIVYRRKHTIC